MKRTVVGIVALAVVSGCHAKFKKNVGALDDINVQALATGYPYVNLGKVYTDSEAPALLQLAAGVVNTVQVVKEINQTERIAQAVDQEQVNAALVQGFAETLRGGPPVAYTSEDSASATLQISVVSYGLDVPYLGAPGSFTYTVKLRMYKPDGDRIYSSSYTCTAAAGDPSVTEQVLGVVNNVRELNEMSNGQINDSFVTTAYWCGIQLVERMRRHAG